MDLEATETRFSTSLEQIPAAEWDHLAGPQPMLQHAFLHALEASGCVSAHTGWRPQHLTLWRQNRLVAAMPLYLKSHSYGEYVFDWSWANAHEQLGLPYYPKLLCAIPFTPVPGPRLLARLDADRGRLVREALAFAEEAGLSSFHCLFPDQDGEQALERAGLLRRQGYQFHWLNPGYASFEDFLASLNRDKRKKIRQERRKVFDAGLSFEIRQGSDIRQEDWEFFHRCYVHTYRAHHSTPYLNLGFFLRLGERLPRHCVVVLGYQEGKPIACALNLRDSERLYGRYWGSQKFVPGLHFETCYYQGMEYCISQGLKVFEGGAQGEHKLARGFLPVITESWHWLADQRIRSAVGAFLTREGQVVEDYVSELDGPYQQDSRP